MIRLLIANDSSDLNYINKKKFIKLFVLADRISST